MENLFTEDNIYLEVEGENFQEVLFNVVKELDEKDFLNEGYAEAVLEREKVFPTGLEFPEYCIAIPHTDSKYIKKDAIAVVKPQKNIFFRDMGTNSKDLEVGVFLLLLISKNENQVSVLSNIIRRFSEKDFYNGILQSNDKKQILNIIKNKEN
ncbi:PTS sugar transporter subunit IIA [Gemella cuniculi]|uniref:PTS sugar transporter subunit IIA n=1 Tax=Gemella cuniculi TaxID=150240 RepID=UPI0003F7DB77|nr:PTS sugar transporter subunit IIA [Gemella cuniculi]